MVMWSLGPYGDSFLESKRSLQQKRFSTAWRWHVFRGSIYLLLFTLAIHCWHYDLLGGVMMFLMLFFDCWGSWPHVMSKEVDDGL